VTLIHATFNQQVKQVFLRGERGARQKKYAGKIEDKIEAKPERCNQLSVKVQLNTGKKEAKQSLAQNWVPNLELGHQG
jgi:hypothetical protein